MQRNPLFKYQLGLAILGIFTLIITGLVVVQAHATKQDAATEKTANDIADKLNDYVSTKDSVPAGLGSVGVSSQPANITYTKVSDSSFKFCVTYKTTSSNFDSSAVALSLATGGKINPGSFDDSSSSYLVIPSSHHKGQNCQTVSPYLFGNGGSGTVTCGILCDSGTDRNTTGSSSSLSNKADDSKRKTDVNSIQSHLEAYYASNGYYPTLSDMNSPTWVAANMKGLDSAAFCDPSVKSTTCQFASSPKKGVYSYEAQDDTYKACVTESSCSSYIVTATLSTGEPYSKFSL